MLCMRYERMTNRSMQSDGPGGVSVLLVMTRKLAGLKPAADGFNALKYLLIQLLQLCACN